MTHMTREEFRAAWRASGRQVCADCGHHILRINSAWGYLYVNSVGIGQCSGPRGLHWP